MNKRPRSHTAAAQVKALIDAASKPLEPPAHCKLAAAAMPFWRAVIASRAADEWSEADLVVGARLARTMADLEAETKALHREGTILGARMNPRCTVIDALSKREMALMRTLRMGGHAAGDSRDELGRRKAARKARKVLEDIGNDGLLA